MNFFRQNSGILTSLGAGVVLGILHWRITQNIMRELTSLSDVIADLQTEVLHLKEKLDNISRRRMKPGDDDEEVYEEAYGGG